MIFSKLRDRFSFYIGPVLLWLGEITCFMGSMIPVSCFRGTMRCLYGVGERLLMAAYSSEILEFSETDSESESSTLITYYLVLLLISISTLRIFMLKSSIFSAFS